MPGLSAGGRACAACSCRIFWRPNCDASPGNPDATGRDCTLRWPLHDDGHGILMSIALHPADAGLSRSRSEPLPSCWPAASRDQPSGGACGPGASQPNIGLWSSAGTCGTR